MMKAGGGIVNLWNAREVGVVTPQNFAETFLCSEAMLRGLRIDRDLIGHQDAINTLSFNLDGSILLSGSSDGRVMLWNWNLGSSTCLYNDDPIVDAKFMQDNSIIASSIAGEVLHIKAEGAEKLHEGLEGQEVYRIAIEPDNPHGFYTCSLDGSVRQFDVRTKQHAMRHLVSDCDPEPEFVDLNAIAFDPIERNLLAVAGVKDSVFIYDVRKWDKDILSSCEVYSENGLVHALKPDLLTDHGKRVTGVAYSNTGELVASYHNEEIYLFSADQVKYCSDSNTSERRAKMLYMGHINRRGIRNVYFLGPRCEYVASGSDTGDLFIWRKTDGAVLRAMRADRSELLCVASHPTEFVIATGGQRDLRIWTSHPFRQAVTEAEIDRGVKYMKMSRKRRINSLTTITEKRYYDYEVDWDGEGSWW